MKNLTPPKQLSDPQKLMLENLNNASQGVAHGEVTTLALVTCDDKGTFSFHWSGSNMPGLYISLHEMAERLRNSVFSPAPVEEGPSVQ